MPIYEFYCPKCDTIFSFLSRSSANNSRIPSCPSCHTDSLEKLVSLFSTVTGKSGTDENSSANADFPIDEGKMMSAMESLASEAGKINEDDPRDAARLMRKLSNMTGLRYQDKIEDAISRMESGEDPEAIEKEMGDSMENDEMPFVLDGKKNKAGLKSIPRRDDRLYEM
jgi:putative FmdB family regulatory protein